jgi:hypothetical protein
LRKPFVVIDAEILQSSIWSESAATKLVWFTLLILCDTDGYVGAAVPGLARQAGVSVEECQAALEKFLSPDPHSRTKEHEGRRIAEADRGWRVLNFQSVLDRMSSERTRSRDRVRRHRARNAMKRAAADGNVTVPAGNRDQGQGTREVRTSEPINQARARVDEPRTDGPKANPFIKGDRPKWEAEALRLTEEIALLLDLDGVEVFQKASGYTGARTSKCNPANLTEDRLVNTVTDLRKMLKQAQERVADKERRGNV